MRRIRVIPVLLIQNGGLVKSIRFRKHQYVGDPINAVRIFNEKEVDEIVILDISASKERRAPNIGQISEIAGEAFMPLAYGGGITNIDQIKSILHEGAEKVILNTSCFDHPQLLSEASRQFGSQSIVASIDVQKDWLGRYRVFRNNGNINSGAGIVDFAKRVEELGAGEIFLTSIERDGTFEGYDLDLISQVSQAVNIPVVACGGAGEVTHFTQAVTQAHASAVAAGAMFVYQRPHRAVLISYPTQKELIEKLFDVV